MKTRALLLCTLALLQQLAAGFDTIVIDAGHGGADPGAVRGRIYEKHIALDVALRLEALLKERGIRTVMTRRKDSTVSLDQRVRLANRFPYAPFVSIHFNASRKSSARGMETFYLGPKGKLLAAAIQHSLDQRVPGKDRGANTENLKVLRGTKAPAALVECGFISNPSDAANCTSSAHRQKLAVSIASGILSLRRKL
jgi:N-acetylmuramoyl-L-alanine amidase